jgi:opacity protein-like surface antigen
MQPTVFCYDDMLGETMMKKNAPFLTCFLMAGCWFIFFCNPTFVSAEMYVAGQAGVNFADRINSIAGTGASAGVPSLNPAPDPDFDLQNSITYGGKVGYFPGHSWYGIEGEVFHSTPHIKQLDLGPGVQDPGIHMRVTTVGVNFIARYPGRTLQPYVGAGIGAAIAHIGDTSTVRSDTDVAVAWNVLVGLRTFITPKIAIFGEYKHTGATLKFDQAFGDLGGFSGNYRAQLLLGGLSYHF